MDRKSFETLERYMLERMKDGAHDEMHVYRVLYAALEIAADLEVDYDVLIAAALLHDIGREAQFRDPRLDHAEVGAGLAYDFLISRGWDAGKAALVRECISAHRFRNDGPKPSSIEAKILFDSDKLDVCGAIGVARTLAYKGIVAEPLYSVGESGEVLDGSGAEDPSFFQEYNYKLKNVYATFYTERAREMAAGRREAGSRFYESLLGEVAATHGIGRKRLEEALRSG